MAAAAVEPMAAITPMAAVVAPMAVVPMTVVMAATKPETDSWTTIWIPVIRIRISIRVSITIRIGVRRYWNRSYIRRPAYCHSHVHPGISFGRCKRQHPHEGKRWKSDFL